MNCFSESSYLPGRPGLANRMSAFVDLVTKRLFLNGNVFAPVTVNYSGEYRFFIPFFAYFQREPKASQIQCYINCPYTSLQACFDLVCYSILKVIP